MNKDQPPLGGYANRIARVFVLVCLVSAAVVYWHATTKNNPVDQASVKPTHAQTRNAYLGDRSCKDCHPGEYAHQTRSGHSHTLMPLAASSFKTWLLGQKAGDSEFQNSHWTYEPGQEKVVAKRTEGSTQERYVLDYVLGSGKHARTFLSLTGQAPDGRPLSLEHRLTFYVHIGALDITPGQSREANSSGRGVEGRSLTAEQTMLCLGCHATRLSVENERVTDPATIIRNVSCERCHGPGEQHVASALRGETPTKTAFTTIADSSADTEMRLCGQCHRLPEFMPKEQITPENALLARFQPVGVMQSKCYTQSGATLSCSTCHDPHARTSTDTLAYNTTCLDCHATHKVVPCRTAPQGNCVSCHMPSREAGQGMKFVDHWIRVDRKK